MDPDLVVLGGGSGGLTAAREAARRGARVVLVEAGRVGGECTFTGCVPSKTLLAAAAKGASFDEAVSRVRAAVDQVAATEDDDALAREGIEVIHGWGEFVAPTRLRVDGRVLRGRRFVIATGARPAIPRIEGVDATDHLTNETIFDLARLPRALVILGGGSIGCELGQAFARLGTQVTLVEVLDRLLPGEEPEASAVIAAALADDGVVVRAGTAATKVSAQEGGGITVTLENAGTLDAQALLVATGRRPTTAGLGLDRIGVELDERGFVATDDTMATSVRGIWAVGDVTGRLALTHAATAMARVAVHNALARPARVRPRRFDPTAVPWVTFTDPEVGRVGMTEEEAAAAAPGARVAFLPLLEVDRAITAGATRGFVKLVAGPRRLTGNAGGGKLLGATVVAPVGGEVIHEAALAMHTRMFTGRLAQTVHAYPTWSLAVQQSAAQFFVEIGGRRARPARSAQVT